MGEWGGGYFMFWYDIKMFKENVIEVDFNLV